MNETLGEWHGSAPSRSGSPRIRPFLHHFAVRSQVGDAIEWALRIPGGLPARHRVRAEFFQALTCSKRGPYAIFQNKSGGPAKIGPASPMQIDKRNLAELKELGAGVEAPDEVVSLYHRSFREFGTQALWSRKPSEHPTITQALIIVEALRGEGGMQMLPLAARLEEACRAAL